MHRDDAQGMRRDDARGCVVMMHEICIATRTRKKHDGENAPIDTDDG